MRNDNHARRERNMKWDIGTMFYSTQKPGHAASIFLALTDCFPLAITKGIHPPII